MIAHRRVFIIAAAMGLAACGEGVGPPPGAEVEQSVPSHALQGLRWAAGLGSPVFSTAGVELVADDSELARASESPLILNTQRVSFRAHRDREASVEIRYRATDGSWRPFLRLTVPKDGLYRRPDGSGFAQGDEIDITVTIDPLRLGVDFEPSGLVFRESAPALLQFWYGGADPDLDGNGTIDDADGHIEHHLLGMWVQEDATDPWDAVSARQSTPDKLFSAHLRHFSKYLAGYAVSH